MKQCSKCKNWKKNSEFHKNKSKKDGLQCYCKKCQSKRDRSKYWQKYYNKSKDKKKIYYQKRKDYYRKWRRKRDRKIKMEIIFKLGGRCQNPDCNIKATQNNLCIFDFHHIELVKKIRNQRSGVENPRSKNFDITKVRLLCANCHRLEHYK